MNAIRYIALAARTLRKSPGLSLTVVVLLGFGIGANCALFSALYAVLLRPISGIENPESLVRVRRTLNGQVQGNQSYPDYIDLRDQAATLDGLAAERLGAMRLSGSPAQMVPAAIVSSNYFQLLGVHVAAGRLFTREDDVTPGGHPIAVVSERFWRRDYGSDSGVIGKTLVLNGYPFTVVGVAAAPFEGVESGSPTSIWIPLSMVRTFMTRSPDYHWFTERRAGWLTYYARLRRGVRIETAGVELNAIALRLAAQYPASNAGRGMVIHSNPGMPPEERRSLRNLFGLLLAAVGLILLIACGNVATLLLARATTRRREMATRLALGANRTGLLMQVLAESLLLGLAGAALGLMLAPWMLAALKNLWGGPEFAGAQTALDLRLLAFTLGVSLVSVLLFGLAPAWTAASSDPAAALKAATPRATGGARLQRAWVVCQVTLSVALVATGSIVLRSMMRIAAIDPGYRPERIVMAAVDLSILGYSPERGTAFFSELAARATAMPGVRSATLAKSTPAQDWSDRIAVVEQGGDESRALTTDRNIVAPRYFETLGIPLLAGRDFTAADNRGAARVAVVSQSLADRLWPGRSALGKQITTLMPGDPTPPSYQVVGVVRDSRYRSVLKETAPLLYLPLLQNYDSILRVMIAVDRPPAQFRKALRDLIRQADPDLPVHVPMTMQEQIDGGLWRQRAAAALLAFFGLLAVALACAGIHGVVSYSAAQRTREIGIRIALGAAGPQVFRQVVGQGITFTAAGIAFGLPLAWWAKLMLQAFLYDAPAVEPLAFAGVPALFLLVALVAGASPARRAAATDPMGALRQE